MTLPGHFELDNPHSSWGRAKCHLCQLWATLSLAACPCKAPCLGSWHGRECRRQEAASKTGAILAISSSS